MYKQLPIFFFFWVICSYASAQNLNDQKPAYLSVKDGLPDASITAICQDSDGFLWIGTSDGLSRYDGVVFVNYYHSKQQPSLPGNYINKLIPLSAHRLLVASTTGLCLFNTRTNTFKNLIIKAEAAMFGFENNFTAIAVSKDGHLWAGSQTCLYELDTALNILQRRSDYRKKGVSQNLFLYVESLRSLPGGNVVFETQQSMGKSPYRWYLSENKKIIPLQNSISPYKRIFDPLQLRDFTFNTEGDAFFIKRGVDSLFFLDVDLNHVTATRLDKIKGNSQISFNSQVSVIKNQFFGCSLLDGGLLYTNMLGAVKANGKPQWHITLPGKHVTSVFCDRENNIWIGTTNGLYKFTMALSSVAVSALPQIGVTTGLNIELSNIFMDNNNIFLSSTGGGLFYTQANEINWKNLTWKPKSELNDTWNIRATGSDRYWIGTQRGLFEWHAGAKHATPLLLSQTWQWINALPVTTQFLDREGILWLGLGVGKGVAAFNLNNKQIKLYSLETPNRFPLRYPVTIAEDELGNLWMGGVEGRGLVCWNRNRDKFTLLPPQFNSEFDSGVINTIYADHRGSLWLGTSGGLFQFNIACRLFKKYGVPQGLSSNTIYSIEADSAKHLWIGTKNGLSCMGLANKDVVNFNGYYQNSEDAVACIKYDATNHKIYFITPHNFYKVAPREWLRRREAPSLFITSIVSSGIDLSNHQNIELHYSNNNINIAFSAVNLVDGGETKYFYRLNSHQKNWTSTQGARQVSFSSLLPGRYAFEVKAQLSDGTWSKNREVLLFSVANPFWKTWWFILLDVTVASLIIYVFYNYRIRQIMALQNIRSSIASDLHDDIGSTLSNIYILTQLSHANLGRPENADRFLTRIAEEVASSSQSLDDIVWSINTNNDNFEQVAARMRRYAADLLESSEIEYHVDFDERLLHKKLNLEQRRDIYLIFKEALNNIYKHAKATAVTIALTTDRDFFKMTIGDNGVGFDPREPTTRNGLKNMHTRVKKHRGNLMVTSQKGAGATVLVVMKIFR
ncbi:ligand-binding sensor domain-containing protein [Mucilaginibacter flavus]|uniref:ligand-binding sensor domain-containing protein n=1 Tax=Mucilaginibacter flavus TaxID=931504 RepID=UPI0025B41135|nr:sensor histidine kinase [Mucilaginibacter flavus]MDN3583474.1 two-component regulator propeller domain-containing protein [Mucilaginibacter flavus]